MAQLKGGFQEGAITNQPHYDRLQDALEKSKKEGSTFKDLDAERDNLLNVLNELVPVYKELTSYNDSKAYMNDGGARGKELAAKYVASVEKFDAAYAKFSDVLTKTNNEQTLADRYNSVVGSVRQVLADSNENNLDEMIQSFNAYIDTYNSTNPEQFDGK